MPGNLIGTFEVEEVDTSYRWQAELAALTGLLTNPDYEPSRYSEIAERAITIGRVVAEEFATMKEE